LKISIIGAAGTLGSCAAFNIAVHGLADEIVLIDIQQNLVMHHAMDMGTAVAAQDILVMAGEYEDITGSDIVVITAGASQGVVNSRMDLLPKNIPIIRDIALKIKQYCPEAVVITASNPTGPLNYAIYLSAGLSREKIIGYTINDSIRFRISLAQALGVKTSQVEGAVIGEHGASQVLLFSSVLVNGKPVTISDNVKSEIRRDIPNILKRLEAFNVGHTARTAGWTSAVGLATVVEAIVNDTGKMVPCSLVLDGEYGCHNLSMTVPAVLGRNGVQKILEWKIDAFEQEDLYKSIKVLKDAMKYVEENLNTK